MLDESQHYGKSTKVIFLERELSQFKNFLENLKGLVMLYFRIRIDFRYCDFYMLILGLCESESESESESEFESESESESGDIYVFSMPSVPTFSWSMGYLNTIYIE